MRKTFFVQLVRSVMKLLLLSGAHLIGSVHVLLHDGALERDKDGRSASLMRTDSAVYRSAFTIKTSFCICNSVRGVTYPVFVALSCILVAQCRHILWRTVSCIIQVNIIL